jgi:hypothetical protein
MEEKPKRRWLRIRLRTAFMVIALLCVPLAQYPYFETRPGPSYTLSTHETTEGQVIKHIVSMPEEIDFRSPTPRLLYALAADVAIVICWWMLPPKRQSESRNAS